MLDTRAGRWLLIGIAAIIAVALTIMFFDNGGEHPFGDVPPGDDDADGPHPARRRHPRRHGGVEPTHRSRHLRARAAAHPRRVGQAVSALLVGLCAFALSVVLAGIAHQAAITFRGITGDWATDGLLLLGAGAYVLLGVAQGVGFGMLFKNTPAAIVVFFVLPTAWSILGSMVSWLRDAAVWLDFNQTMQPLFEGSLTGAQWAHLATSVAVWVVAPLAVGIWRLTRAEVK